MKSPTIKRRLLKLVWTISAFSYLPSQLSAMPTLAFSCAELLTSIPNRAASPEFYPAYLQQINVHNKAVAKNGGLYLFPVLKKYFGHHLPDEKGVAGETYNFSPEEQENARIIFENGKVLYAKTRKPFDSSASTKTEKGKTKTTGTALFVMDENGNFYAVNDQIVGKIHHSSILGGRPVAAAGEMKVINGQIILLSDQSGHYAIPSVGFAQARQALESHNALNYDAIEFEQIGFEYLLDNHYFFEDNRNYLETLTQAGIPQNLILDPRHDFIAAQRKLLDQLPIENYFRLVNDMLAKDEVDPAMLRAIALSFGDHSLRYRFFDLDRKHSDQRALIPLSQNVARNFTRHVLSQVSKTNKSLLEEKLVLQSFSMRETLGENIFPELKKLFIESKFQETRDAVAMYGFDLLRKYVRDYDLKYDPKACRELEEILDFYSKLPGESENIDRFGTYTERAAFMKHTLLLVFRSLDKPGSLTGIRPTVNSVPNMRWIEEQGWVNRFFAPEEEK